MTKTLKNIVLIFTLVCAIFLIVFSIELMVINRNNDDSGTYETISGDALNGNDENGEEPPGNGEALDDSPPPDAIIPENDDEVIIIPLTDGRKYELTMLMDGYTLVLYADESLFEFAETQREWIFTYVGDGAAELKIAQDYISPTDGGMRGLARRLLTRYLDGGDSLPMGDRLIGASSLMGYAVSGEHEDGRTFEAWIHHLEERDRGMAVVFIIYYETESQKDALFEILDTIEMVIEEPGEPEEIEDEE